MGLLRVRLSCPVSVAERVASREKNTSGVINSEYN